MIGILKTASASFAFVAMACAHTGKPKVDFKPEDGPSLSPVLRLVGRFSVAQACPVSEHIAITAAHVVDLRPFDADAGLWPYQWGDNSGQKLRPFSMDASRDLAYTQSIEPFPHFYPIAKEPPVTGETLWFIGYDWRDKGRAYAGRRFKVKVLRIVSRSIIFADAGEPGTSGSCVINAAGEVVGINVWGKELDNKQEVGIAVGIWGESVPVPEPPKPQRNPLIELFAPEVP